MTYGLKEPEKTGICPGNAHITAAQMLDEVLKLPDNPKVKNYYRRQIDRIYKYGVTASLIKELNDALGALAQNATPVIDPQSRELSWVIEHQDVARRLKTMGEYVDRFTSEGKEHIDFVENQKISDEIDLDFADSLITDAHETIREMQQHQIDFAKACCAYTLAYFIDDGVLDYLRQCERPECKRYFIGGPRAKWCSTNCGSIVRVKVKRKRDREVGNLESRYL